MSSRAGVWTPTLMASRSDDELAPFILANVEGLHDASQEREKGSGAYGVVYKVTVDGMPCIAKRLHAILTREVSQREKAAIQTKFRHECVLLSRLRHPNIVHFVGVCYGKSPGELLLIMECLHTDLANFLETQPGVPLPDKLSILLDVSYGLLYLHSSIPPIIHRDLTAPNILLTQDLHAKIADLGVSKLLSTRMLAARTQTKGPGQILYMPPEALKENPKYDSKLDIFSFGHMAIYVTSQEFPNVYEVTIIQSVLQQGTLQILKRRKALDAVGADHCLYPLITQCLMDKPERRPTTDELNKALIKLDNQCAQGKRKCYEAEGRNEELVEKLKIAETEGKLSLKVQLGDTTAKSEKLQAEVVEWQTRCSKVEDDCKELRVNLKETEDILKELQATVDHDIAERLQNEQDEGKKALLKLHGSNRQLLHTNSVLENDRRRLSQKAADMTMERDQLQESNEGLRAVLKNVEEESLRNKRNYKSKQCELSGKLKQLDQLRKRKKKLEDELEVKKLEALTYREDFETERRGREQITSAMVEQKAKMELQYEDLQMKLREKAEKVDATPAQVQTKQRMNVATAESQHSDTDHQQLEEARAEVAGLKEDLAGKTQQVKQYYKQVEDLRRQDESQKREISALKRQHETQRHQIESQWNEIEILKKRVSSLRTQIQLKLDEIELLHQDHQDNLQIVSAQNKSDILNAQSDLNRVLREKEQLELQLRHIEQSGYRANQEKALPVPQKSHPYSATDQVSNRPNIPGRHPQQYSANPNYPQGQYQPTAPPTTMSSQRAQTQYPAPMHTSTDDYQGTAGYQQSQAYDQYSNLPIVSNAGGPSMTVVTPQPAQTQDPPQHGKQLHGGSPRQSERAHQDSLKNPLEIGIIHNIAAGVGEEYETESLADVPFDPNLVCPMCGEQFRIGEIQKFRRHVQNCLGSSGGNPPQ